MNFRPHLPEECPPDDASPTTGKVYRMVKETPSKDDFLSFRECKPNKHYPSECIASGLSVYTEKAGIQRLQARVPRFRKMAIARAELSKTHGRMKNTPSHLHQSHHTWWLAVDIEPWTFFEVVSLEDEE